MKKLLLFFLTVLGLLGTGNIALAVIPTISYNTTNVYTVGTNIGTLSPTLGGGAVAAFAFGAATTFTGGGIGGSYGIAVDAAGNYYVADYANNRVREFNAAGASVGTFGTGIPNAFNYDPIGIVFDSSGNAYVLDRGNGVVLKLNAAGAYQSTVVTGIGSARGIGIDASGNLYVVDSSVPSVTKYTSTGTVVFTITVNLNNPYSVAVAPTGIIYVADRGSNNILEYSSTGTYIGVFKAGFSSPYAVATDAVGNIYVADGGASRIIDVYNPGGTLLTSIATGGGSSDRGLVVDSKGNLIVSDEANATVKKYPPVGGYYLTTGTLPAGLSFDSTTGKITGTPTVAFGPSNFVVTAYNASGAGVSNTFTIQCNLPPTVLTYSTPNVFSVGVPVSLTPTYSNGAPTSVTIVSVPAGTTLASVGLSISATGVITGTPTATLTATNFVVTATNAGGNANSNTFSIAIVTAPVFSYTSPQIYTQNLAITSLSPTITSGGPLTGATISPALPTGLTISAAGVISGTPTVVSAATTYTITATGSSGGPGTATVVISVVAPPVFAYATQIYTTGVAITALSPTGTGTPLTNATISGLPAGLSMSATGVITGTPTTVTAAANYTVTATGSNGGTGTATVRITVVAPPVFGYVSPQIYGQGVAITALSPTGAGTPLTGASISPALPTGLTISATGVISGTPTVLSAATTYTVTATGSNGGIGTATVIISVVTPPSFSYTGPNIYTRNLAITALSPTVASDGPLTGATINPALPAGLTISAAGVISGTPTATSGATTYTITAIGANGGPGTATVVISVVTAPVFAYATQIYTTGVAITALSPTGTGTPLTNATISGLPAGLSMSATGVITGTPTTVTAATNYTVTATGSNGGTGTATVNITVVAPPVFSYTNPAAYTVGTAIANLSPTITSDGPLSGASISPALPAGLTISAAGVIQGTPTASSGTTTYTVTATGADGGIGTATVVITVNPLPLPGFTYTPAASYLDGTAMTLSPVNNGGAGTVSAFAFGTGTGLTGATLSTPYGIAINPVNSDIYVTNYGNNTISYYNSAGTYQGIFNTFGAGNQLVGIVFDSSGNAYIADRNNGDIYKVTAAGVKSTIVTGLNSLRGITIDASGNLFVTSGGSDQIYKYSNTGTLITTYNPGNNAYPTGTAIDASGNMYVVDRQDGNVIKYNSSGTFVSTFATGFTVTGGGNNGPYAIAIDGGGNVYVSNTYNNSVSVYNSGGTLLTTVTGLNLPYGLTVDASGNLYVVNQGTPSVVKYPVVGGYVLNYVSGTTSLPPGLAFNHTTGTISGTPTSVFTGSYTVTGYNATGSYTCTSFTIVCGAPPVITYATPNTWTVGTAYTLTPTSTGGTVTTWAITGTLPAGVTFSTSTGVISGTPTAVMALTSYTVTATNTFGTSSPTFTITVNQVSPNITYVTPDVYTVGAVVSLPVTNPNSAVTISYAITAGTLPAGLTLNTTNGLISGTANTVTAATTVTVTASTGTSTGSTTVAITVNPLPPVISYTNPAPYIQGTTIPNLVPSNSGGPVSTTGTFGPGVVVLKAANGMNKPYGMTADASGNVYVVNFGGNSVTEYSTTGTITTTSISTGGTGPAGLVFDSAGNAYVLFKTSNKVVEYAGGNFAGTATPVVTGLNAPTGIAIDASDELYIANSGANNILEYSTTGVAGLIITPPNNFFAQIANVSAGIAVDAAGNIYVADADLLDLFAGFFGTTVDVYNSSGTFTTFYEIGTANSAVSIDANGNIYVTDTGAKSVTDYTAAFASTTDTEVGYNSPQGTVADGLGDYFVSDYNANTVTEYSPVKGYYLTGTLPPGLYFDPTSGTISGKPQTTFALTTYTVTAYNAGGKGTTTFKISCVANPPVIAYTPPSNVYQLNLPVSAPTLSVSGGPIMPSGFAAGTTLPGTLSNPWGMTTDASGNIWVVNYGNATVIKYSAAGAVLNTFAVKANPTGIAVDAAGNFYISTSNGDVYKYNAAGAIQNASTVTTINNYKILNNGFAGGTADGIAIDASGNLYVSDNTDGIVWKIPSGSTTATQFVYEPTGGILQPSGIAVDAAGNVFIVDLGAKALIEYSPLGAYEAKIETGLSTPYGLYIDANGDYFVSDPGSGTVREYSEGGGLIVTKITGLTNPRGLVTDAAGDIYVSDYTKNTVTKYPPVFYTISPGLPAGLTFNTTTGAIGGTPTTIFGPTVFTVSVDGSDGNASTMVTLQCASPPVFTYSPLSQVDTVGMVSPSMSPVVTAGGPVTGYTIAPGLPGGLSIDPVTGIISGTPTAISPLTTYTVTATNSFGFTGTAPVTITVVNPRPPVITYPTPEVYITNVGITPLAPTNTGGLVVTYSAPVLPAGLTIDPVTGIISGTPTTITAATDYPVTATNAGGSSTFNINITVNPPPPIISYVSPDVYNVGVPVSLSPSSTGGPVLTWSVSPALPAGLSIDPVTGIISGTPTFQTAAANYTVTATNAGGTATCIVNITITIDAPIISYTTPDVYTVGSVIAPLIPTNTGGAPASYSISPGLPAGLSFDTTTGIITGTPTAVSAAANYVVTATNTGGVGTFTINIACVAGGPVLSYITPDIFPVNVAITPLSPTNTGTAPVSYSISPGLPTGLSIDPVTGVISGTPTVTSGATVYTVTATDGSSNIGTTTITISCSGYVDWIGVTSTDWNDPTNWATGAVPTATDIAAIGVNQTFDNFPNLLAGAGTINVGSVVIGTSSTHLLAVSTVAQAGGFVVNTGSTLNITGAINYQSDANSGLGLVANISGAGSVTAAGINVTANTSLGATYTETMASSIASLILSSDVALTSSDNAGTAFNSAFNVTGGITAVGGTVTTTNTAAATSTLSVTGATLQLAGAAPLSGLSAIGTNVVGFNNAGATIEYSGGMQTYYTDAGIQGLAGGESYNSIKFSGSGLKSPTGTNANKLNIAGDFTNALTLNDASDYIDLSLPTVIFNGATQNINAGNGTGTTFYNTNFTGASATTIQSGEAYIGASGTLTMSGTATLAAGGLLTLNSAAAGSATVAAIPAGCAINGTVNVQRFVTGGNGYRGYRLGSSPVWGSTANSYNIYSINYLINSIYLKGTTGNPGGFDEAGNPNIYLYRENLAPSNTTFTSGNFRGVNTIGTAPNFNYLIDSDPGTFNIPVGGGFMVFFRGDRHVASIVTESALTYVPTNTILTASGTLNQQQVTATDWYTPTSQYLGWTTTAGNSTVQGYNLVGNPYASSIDWNAYQTGSTTTGIYANNLATYIYELNPVTNNYDTYDQALGTGTNNGTNIIASGQGFFVRALNTNPQLIFNESAKTSTQNTGPTLFMSTKKSLAAVQAAPRPHLRLQVAMDSVNKDDIYIGFNASASNGYVPSEDASYKPGNGKVGLSSFSSDNVSLAINQMPFPGLQRQVIPLDVRGINDGTYTIKLTEQTAIPPLFTIWLKDAYMKDSLDVRANSTYVFDILHSDTNTYGSHRFTLVMGQNPALMIHLLSFGASKIQTGDQVVWTTENEQNYTNFTVERSIDNGTTFNDLGGFPSSGQGAYSYLDRTPANGANMYRLKIVDLNGTISYSNVVTIMYANTNGQIAINGMMVYPNPTAGKINLSITSSQTNGTSTQPAKSNYSIEIVNNLGSVIKSSQSSSPLWQSDVSALTPGTYFIRVIDASNNKVVGKTAFVKL